MKKALLGVLIIALVLGGGYYVTRKSSTVTSGTTTKTDVFTSIKDALAKSLSLQCEFTDEQGKKNVSHIKAGAVRADFDEGSSIFKDQKIYFWQKNQKNGFLMEIKEDIFAGATPTTSDAKSEGLSAISELEKYKDKCKPAVVSDSLFTPPTDVKFVNFEELMKNPGAGFQIPNIEVPSE